ncbi:MAG: secretin N-terminal domain-containing protein [Porticoccaceae bacterium]
MYKRIVLLTMVLSGCATPFGQGGKNAVDEAMQAPGTADTAPEQTLPGADAVQTPAPPPPRPVIPERRFSLTVNNASAAEVFLGMVTDTPYSMLVHPDVTGTLTLNLKNVTLPEAMEAIRALYGYEYEVHGTRIIVPSPAEQTRVYQINALAMQRVGKSDMRVVSGSVSLSEGGGGGGGGGDTGGPAAVSQSLETSSVQTTTDSRYWKELSASIKTLVGKTGSVVVSPQSGVIIVKATPADLHMVEKFLRLTELIGARQVMLEAKILEVQLNDTFQSGINWARLAHDGKLGFGVNGLNLDGVTPINPIGTVDQMLSGAIPGADGSVFGVAFNDGDFGAIINLMKSQGVVHVLSSPRIAALNNQKAVLKVGTDDFFVTEISGGTVATLGVPATPPNVVVQPFFSGIALDVTPQIDDRDTITLHVRPSVSNVREDRKDIDLGDLGSFTLPLASSSISETDSVVRLKNGQVVAIGGLMSQTFDDSKNRIPLLGDIPVLGQLFGNTRLDSVKRELVVLIKTTLIRDSEDWNADLDATRQRFRNYDFPPPALHP